MSVVWMRRIRTAALRLAAFVVEERWILLSLSLAAVGVVGVRWDIPHAVNVALAATSLWLAGLEIRAHVRRARDTQFVDRSQNSFEDVAQALAGNARFTLVKSVAGTFLADSVASRRIAEGIVTAALAGADYVLPRELRAPGTLFQRRRVAAIDTYNGAVVGLDTNVGIGGTLPADEWRMVASRYWDHLASDIFAMKDVFVAHHLQPEFGRALFIDRHGLPRDHGDSWLLNAVGASVLALTSDHRLVVVSQSAKNESSGGLLAPSGSGSLESADFRGAKSLEVRVLARNGGLRELEEESGIREDAVAATAFLGYGRWLEKAAKPELLTLALLSIDSHAVKRLTVPSSDRPYTLWVEVCRIVQVPEKWDPKRPEDMLGGAVRGRLSLPLFAGLGLLAEARGDVGSPAGALIDAAFRTFRV